MKRELDQEREEKVRQKDDNEASRQLEEDLKSEMKLAFNEKIEISMAYVREHRYGIGFYIPVL